MSSPYYDNSDSSLKSLRELETQSVPSPIDGDAPFQGVSDSHSSVSGSSYAPSDDGSPQYDDEEQEQGREQEGEAGGPGVVSHHSSQPNRPTYLSNWSPREPGERQNRFTGHPNEWRTLTAPDRQIVAGLDIMANRDLSRHLYNAYMLKRRLSEKRATGQGSRGDWKIGKHWTAWPMTPGTVPRPGERTRNSSGPFVHMRPLSSRKELEEELLATTARIARKRFMETVGPVDDRRKARTRQRVDKESTTLPPIDAPEIKVRDDEIHETPVTDWPPQMFSSQPMPTHGFSSDTSSMSSIRSPVSHGDEDEEERDGDFGGYEGEGFIDDEASASEVEYELAPTSDQAFIERMLGPSVRNVADNFDTLLMALHRSRQTHAAAKPPPRPQVCRKKFRLVSRSASQSKSKSSRTRSRTRSQGATTKSGAATPGDESEDDFRSPEDSDEESDESLDDESSGKETSQPASRSRNRSAHLTARERSARLGLRDWRDVLGHSAISGAFPPAVIERARQRCEALFKQKMDMRLPVQEGHIIKVNEAGQETLGGVRLDGFLIKRPMGTATGKKRNRGGKKKDKKGKGKLKEEPQIGSEVVGLTNEDGIQAHSGGDSS